MNNYKFILSGGGTGGHIYPAIAIANELKLRYPDAEILFVGASNKMEMQKVPQAGYPIKGLPVAGFQRKLTFQNFLFPFKLFLSLWKSFWILKSFKPNFVIGTGGFASGPLLQIANFLKIPTLVQEQNSFPGVTNKLLSAKAAVICTAYDGLDKFFPKDKIVLTGNPVRNDLINLDHQSSKEDAKKHFQLDKNKKTLLVLGGSLGAKQINLLIENKLDLFAEKGYQIIWQCGKIYKEIYQKYNSEDVKVLDFIDKMDLAYIASDIIISRAGASSVSELALVGKPTIFIPSPNVAEDHQTKNALAIVDKNGAIMLKESQLDADFEATFSKLSNDEVLQLNLAKALKLLAKPNATKEIVNEIEKILKL